MEQTRQNKMPLHFHIFSNVVVMVGSSCVLNIYCDMRYKYVFIYYW